jgi:subtilisin family serine protease
MYINRNNFFSKGIMRVTILVAFPFLSFAQKPNWQNLDLKTDSTFGISTEKAYSELLKGKKFTPVVVGVLDGGVDFNHEDLKSVIWINKKEKAGNGKDDDKNGYVDDVRGWNFLGSAKGSVSHEALELTRIIRRDQAKFDSLDVSAIKPKDLAAYQAYSAMKMVYDRKLNEAKNIVANIQGFKGVVDAMVKKIGKENPTAADFAAFKPSNDIETRLKSIMTEQLKDVTFADFYKEQIVKGLEHYQDELQYNLNLNYDPRAEFVGDNYADSKERFYGSNDVQGPDASHGTHVSGIIAADRNNNIGVKGVANHVMIMGVRAVPDGDERDKDVANSIRYAVDNGAKVLNMSFGKAYSWDKNIVDEAVKYAMSKDVLLVQAAGNENENIDTAKNFPSRIYASGQIAGAYIVVGASGFVNDSTLKASFSNYGKTAVDVFAPGVNINSTVPGSKYEKYNGTSMASPVVAGLAALIRSYYPKLSALQVKDIIMKSVVKVDHNVSIKVREETKSVPFSDLSVTGGVVNAYNALQMAASYDPKKSTGVSAK